MSKCFTITIYLFLPVHECPKEENQTSSNQIQLQKETKILIHFSIWPWTCILTTNVGCLPTHTQPYHHRDTCCPPKISLFLSCIPALPFHMVQFPSYALQKLAHLLFVGSSHHTPDAASAFPPDQHHYVLSCWNHTNDSHSLICRSKWFSKTGLMPP